LRVYHRIIPVSKVMPDHRQTIIRYSPQTPHRTKDLIEI
jgi:hypothetical protein